MIDQADTEEKMSGGYLYVGVIHNQRRRPVYVRLRLLASVATGAAGLQPPRKFWGRV